MSGAHSLAPALPSPPSGVPIPIGRQSPLTPWLRQAVLAHISAEPTDLAGRIAIGATLVPWLVGLALPDISSPFWGVHNRLFWFYTSLWAPTAWITMGSAFITRSRSARLLGVVPIATFALLSTADRFGFPPSLVVGLVSWVFPAVTKVVLGLWLVRALRRRLDDSAA